MILWLHIFFQDENPGLQAILSGEIIISTSKELTHQGQKDRALAMLHQMIEDAHKGKRQFLSGMLFALIVFVGKTFIPAFYNIVEMFLQS